jgi:Ran GTPase-activating protein (RanGAP) involved in mRNA processing and transport
MLEEINLRGNGIGDRGIAMIEHNFIFMDKQMPTLSVLNLSANDITKEGIKHLIPIINCCKLRTLNLSKNLLAD